MKIESFRKDLAFSDQRVVSQLILETPFSREIRVLMKQGQAMKEHQSSSPIVVHILEGQVDFGIEGEKIPLQKGDILTLDAGVLHDLKAGEDSIVRLTVHKGSSTN